MRTSTKHWVKYWLLAIPATMASFVKVPLRAKGYLKPRFQRTGDFGVFNIRKEP